MIDVAGHELPFIIGISGHRDVVSLVNEPQAGEDGVKRAIKECLIYWKQQLNEHTPIWLMTGMAEGVDMLAIEAADELILEGWARSSIKVVPCLPMPQSAFVMDFTSSSSLEQFQAQMARFQSNTIIIKSDLPSERFNAALIDSDYGDDRNSLYMNLAGFLARTCNVVICVWDGLDVKGSGGTADVAKLKLGIPVFWPIEEQWVSKALLQPETLDRHFGGVIQHIPVLRRKASKQPSLAGRLLPCTGLEHNDFPCYVTSTFNGERESICQRDQSNELKELLEQLVTYNRDVQDKLSDKFIIYPHPELSDSAEIFNKADGFAQQFQSIYRRRMIAFFAISLLGLAAYELVGNYLGVLIGIVLTGMILVTIIFCISLVKGSQKKQWKWKYQLARGVAESLRIRGYLNMADIEPDNKPLIQRRFKRSLPIFEQSIMIAELEWWKYVRPRDDEKVNKEWLAGQKKFLEQRLEKVGLFTSPATVVFKRQRAASERLGNTAKTMVVLSTLLGVALLILQINMYLGLDKWTSNESILWLMMVIQYLMMFAGATALWSELANYDSTASGYHNLVQLYEIAINNMNSGDERLISITLHTLAREALLEHCEWSQYESQSDLQTKAYVKN